MHINSFLSRTYFIEGLTRLRSMNYNFTEVQVSRVIVYCLIDV